MAVHPSYPRLCAEVVVDAQPLREFDADDVNEGARSKVITKYVEAISDAYFGVRYTIPKDLSGACGVHSNLRLDGKSICSVNHSHEQITNCDVTNCLDTFYSTVDGARYEQQFRFSQLQIGQCMHHCAVNLSDRGQERREIAKPNLMSMHDSSFSMLAF